MTDTHLHIDRIALHGMASLRGQETVLGEAVAAELTRLFSEDGVPPGLLAGGTAGAIVSPPVQVTPGAGSDALGVDVARSVYRSLGAGSAEHG
jgi:hypothetical protein